MADTDTETKTARKKTHRYVVLADAVVVTLGRKSNGKTDYTRVMRGGVINGVEGAETIADLVRKGSIREVKNQTELDTLQADLRDPAQSRHRQTARRSSLAMGAPEDPVAKPLKGALPMAARDLPDGVDEVGTIPAISGDVAEVVQVGDDA